MFNNRIIRIVVKSLIVFFMLTAMIVISTVSLSYSSYIASDYEHKKAFFQPVIKKLIKRGVDNDFIYNILSDKSTKFNERFVKINITGFLKKTDYSHNYNYFSIKKTKEFIAENFDILIEAETQFGVPKEVIASILWVETKHGSILGDNQIASVFLSTAMSDQTQFVMMNRNAIREDFSGDSTELVELEKKLMNRITKKTAWALNELVSMSKMNKKAPYSINKLKGSWAGAFGISQFLPSSYISWAVDGNNDKIIDLFDLDDAIFSVANYLKKNGWGSNYESWRKAVYHYNNSNDYVDAVLKLAQKAGWKADFKK